MEQRQHRGDHRRWCGPAADRGDGHRLRGLADGPGRGGRHVLGRRHDRRRPQLRHLPGRAAGRAGPAQRHRPPARRPLPATAATATSTSATPRSPRPTRTRAAASPAGAAGDRRRGPAAAHAGRAAVRRPTRAVQHRGAGGHPAAGARRRPDRDHRRHGDRRAGHPRLPDHPGQRRHRAPVDDPRAQPGQDRDVADRRVRRAPQPDHRGQHPAAGHRHALSGRDQGQQLHREPAGRLRGGGQLGRVRRQRQHHRQLVPQAQLLHPVAGPAGQPDAQRQRADRGRAEHHGGPQHLPGRAQRRRS